MRSDLTNLLRSAAINSGAACRFTKKAIMTRISEVLGFFAGLLLIAGALMLAAQNEMTGPDLDPAHLVD
jgi:hypothetical protein